MKNALLITGGPASGKNLLAFTLANKISPDKRAWLFCTKSAYLRLSPETKVVIVDEIRRIEAIERFLELLDKGPFFIFLSPKTTILPDEDKWTRHLAHFHLSNPFDGTLLYGQKNGVLPANIVQTISQEMEKRMAAWQQNEAIRGGIAN